jgi:hypothetical protein
MKRTVSVRACDALDWNEAMPTRACQALELDIAVMTVKVCLRSQTVPCRTNATDVEGKANGHGTSFQREVCELDLRGHIAWLVVVK